MLLYRVLFKCSSFSSACSFLSIITFDSGSDSSSGYGCRQGSSSESSSCLSRAFGSVSSSIGIGRIEQELWSRE